MAAPHTASAAGGAGRVGAPEHVRAADVDHACDLRGGVSLDQRSGAGAQRGDLRRSLSSCGREDIKKATLLLDQGWADGYTVNGQAPQPLTQGSSDGRLVYGLGHIPAGHMLVFWLSLQVNPTTLGRRRQSVSLYDGQRLLATVHRSVFVFP